MKLEDDKAELLDRADAVAQASKGTGGPPHAQVGELLGAYYRHVAPEDLLGRSPEDVYGALASHYSLASSRPQGTATVRVVTPGPVDVGWSAAGHSVVEVVTDDMPFLVDSVTMELVPAQPQRARRHPPALRGDPRHHRRPADGEHPGGRRGRGGRTRRARRVVDARRDRPGRRRGRGRPRSSTASSECSATSARRSRTGARCATGRSEVVEDIEANPPPIDAERDQAELRLHPVARRRPLHVPRLPRIPPRVGGRGPGRGMGPARRTRHRPRHPARRPGHVVRPSPSCRRSSRTRPARRRCWCWRRPTPARPCTALPTSTTSA